MRSKNILLGTLVLALSIGCAPSNPGITLEGVLAPDTSCMVTATSNFLLQGTLDTTPDMPIRPGGITYSVALQVGNQLFNNQQRVYPLMADPDRIIVDHVEVTLQNTGGGTLGLGLANPYLVVAHGSIDSTASMDPTLALAEAEIIPANYGMALNTMFGSQPGAEIVAQLRVMGTTVGGAQLTSEAYLFPIHLCVGCLFQCACDAMMHPINSPSCLPGQDTSSGVACTACP